MDVSRLRALIETLETDNDEVVGLLIQLAKEDAELSPVARREQMAELDGRVIALLERPTEFPHAIRTVRNCD